MIRMNRSEKIQHILAGQGAIDENIAHEYPDFPYDEDDLKDLDDGELGSIVDQLDEAMEKTFKNYEDDFTKHGRAE